MKRIITSILFSAFVTLTIQAQQHLLWYDKPATHWLQALPIGNSHLGAMIYGDVKTEEIQLNEETFWSGSPYYNNSPESKAHLQEVRQLIFEGKEKEAHALIDQYFIKGPHGMRFLPVGSVKLAFHRKDNTSSYRRQLNLGTALATTQYTLDGVTYRRTCFASQADNAIIVRIEASEKGALSFNVSFDSPLETSRSVNSHQLAAIVKGVEQEGVPAGLQAECRLEVLSDGEIVDGEESIAVVSATTVTLYITAATNFVNYHDVSGEPTRKNIKSLSALRGRSYQQILNSHLAKLPTDRRLTAFDGSDLDMVSLMMQYGRYLLISSSQPGGQPANLQGVWNNKMEAPWDSKYTININAEMNYWPALIGNLAETQQPFFSMISDLTSRLGRCMVVKDGWPTTIQTSGVSQDLSTGRHGACSPLVAHG